MTLVTTSSEQQEKRREDHYVHLEGATWADYQRLLEIRGERATPRITFLKGRLEIMTPSREHESYKSTIGRLVEVWCLENDVAFSTYGSWTLEDKETERGAEPDECYVFGEVTDPKRPDLAIEVVWTSGGLNKLDVYRELNVREVWFWRRGVIQPYLLHDDGYRAVDASRCLPKLDLALLASFLDRTPTSRAIQDYRAALQANR